MKSKLIEDSETEDTRDNEDTQVVDDYKDIEIELMPGSRDKTLGWNVY